MVVGDRDMNLYQNRISKTLLSNEKAYLFSFRYRDQNLKWSNWSDLTQFKTVWISDDPVLQNGYFLNQNYPNPFQNNTTIIYNIPERNEVIFRI